MLALLGCNKPISRYYIHLRYDEPDADSPKVNTIDTHEFMPGFEEPKQFLNIRNLSASMNRLYVPQINRLIRKKPLYNVDEVDSRLLFYTKTPNKIFVPSYLVS